MWKAAFATFAALAALALATATAVVAGGWYDVRATTQHTQPVYWLMETTLRRSVQRQARHIRPPPLDDPQQRLRGAACFRDKCVQCHGGPGVAPGDIGKSMQPLPGPLVDAARRWRAREIYWITRHGIRMTGMPAWEYRLDDTDLWAVVAFVVDLPGLSPQAYQARIAQVQDRSCTPDTASAARGRVAMTQYACAGCHTIPGITGSQPQVGPPLAGMARRQLIAGRLPNTPRHMAAWLRHPTRIDPRTAMPDLGVTAADARDMAAYLATLR
jgi:mono/diheme cytochrome c family protein